MPKKKTNRNTLLSHASRLFRVNGYHHTTMADIGDACGLIKGSIYHYFPSKDALGLAALKQQHDHFEEALFTPARDESVPVEKRLHAFCDGLARYYQDSEGGCLSGNLALELGDDLPRFKAAIRALFLAWEEVLAELLEEAHPVDAAYLARERVAATQGALMRMRLFGNAATFKRVNATTRALLDEPSGD